MIGEAMLSEGSGTQEGLTNWIVAFRDRALQAGISSATLDALNGAEYLPKVVHNDRHQNEFTKTIWEYLDKAVSEDRIAHGVKALKTHKDVLARIEATYGPGAEIDRLDGVSLAFPDWRLNLRKSNTEPVLRLNVETRGDRALLETRVAELAALIGTPGGH